MKQFIVVACLALSVVAKPGPGYSYNAPSSGPLNANLLPPSSAGQGYSYSGNSHQSYAPSHGSLGLSYLSNGGSLALGSSYAAISPVIYTQHGNGASSYNSFNGNSNAGLSSSGSHSFGGASHGFGGASHGFNGASNNFGAASNGFASGSNNFGAASNGFASGSNNFGGSSFVPSSSLSSFVPSAPAQSSFIPSPVAPGQAIIQKHIYVHVPPPEAEEPAEIIRSAPQPINHQKHYKIIFIKAPSTSSKQIVHQQLQQTEEKTLVYVLVKKPEPVQEIHQIQAPSVIPSKPEVYFIKYKAQTGLSDAVPLSAPSSVSGAGFSGFSSGGSLSGSSSTGSLSGLSSAGSLSGLSSQTTHLSPASDFSSSVSISSSSSSSDASGLNLGSASADASVATIIQPRTPAPEYGPPKH